jgi:restriction system protein
MAAPKRRKPGNPTARLESRAEAAWIRQNVKIEAAETKEKARQEEKAAREREVVAGQAEAVTRVLQARLTELETLLASTLGEDPYLPFERLKEPMPQARFQPPPQLAESAPAPELDAFLPPPLSGLGALAPGHHEQKGAA